MIKAKEASVKNLAVLLAFSFAVSAVYYLSRPQVATRSVPVFAGEEVVVQRAGEGSRGQEKAVMAEKAMKAEKALAQPAPAPIMAAPLPIVPPSITLKVLPVYPTSAIENNLAGTVLLSVYVGLGGQPEKVETKTSSGVKELDETALAAVAQWKFSPAAQGGAALASWLEIPITFLLK